MMTGRARGVGRWHRALLGAIIALGLTLGHGFGHRVAAAAAPGGFVVIICGADGPYRLDLDPASPAPDPRPDGATLCCIAPGAALLAPPATVARPAPPTRAAAAWPAEAPVRSADTTRRAHGPRAPPL